MRNKDEAEPFLPRTPQFSFHFGTYLFGLYFFISARPVWVMLILGFTNDRAAAGADLLANGECEHQWVGHNFIHNPFFRLQLINRLFGVTQSIACCFSKTMNDAMHMQHHKENSDRQDETGHD